MPKVETSLNLGAQLFNTKYDSNYVSNNTGKEVDGNLHFKIGNSDTTKLSLRIKRDSNSNGNVTDTPNTQKRKRVVKKLVRVQAINNTLNDDAGTSTSTEANEYSTTTKRARRRLRVKKKKKRLHNQNTKNIDSDYNLHQATKPRRKIIVTRKRLLPKTEKSQDVSPNIVISSNVMTSVVESTMQSYQQSLINDANTSIGIGDVTEENFVVDGTDNYNDEYVTNASILDTDNHIENIDIDDEGITNRINSADDANNDDTDEGIKKELKQEINGNDEYKTDETKIEEYEDATEENTIDDINNYDDSTEVNDQPTFQNIPEYEPFFPELSESFDAPVLLLKTTVFSSIELVTKTVVQSRLRTYTFVVTRVNGDEQIVTSTTEVKPQIRTSILTEPYTKFTTLTLLDFDATQTLTEPQNTILPTLDNPQPQLLNQDNAGRGYEEARYNLATRIMSNGVEVIVAGDKSTLPGNPDFKRLLPSNVLKPVTLKPSTLTDHMVMMLPQDESNIETLSSLYPSQFVTKTCLTTFTYLTTFLEGSTTTVSSREQVVSNVATEERNTGKILPTPAIGITLTQYPNLSVGVFHTTYTYLNTILDGEQPLVVSSKHTVTNTVTAPDSYLSLLKPSETLSAIKDTNTYYSTVALEKTLYEGDKSSVVSTREVVTQVVITESVPPRATSVMTSYIALDMEEPNTASSSYTTTDVVKTYYVTYTYYNTVMEDGKTVVNTNISTSSDVVTEKLFLHPKKTVNNVQSTSINSVNKKHDNDLSGENFHILATKSYFTTFTHFTTLLQENNFETPTVVSSRTRVIENIVTETVDPNLLDKQYLINLRNEFKEGSNSITKLATLQDGQKLEIIAIANEIGDKIEPTNVLPIEKTNVPETMISSEKLTLESSTPPSVITGSTIIFVDDDPFAQLATPTLTSKLTTATSSMKNNLGSLLSSEIVKNTRISTAVNKSKRSTKTKIKSQVNVISPTNAKPVHLQNTSTNKKKPQNNQGVSSSNKRKPQNDKKKQTIATATKITKPVAPAADLLGLGSINMNSLQALTPVLNAMAGLIQTNLKPNRRSDANITTTTTPTPQISSKGDHNFISATDIQNRSPIYIPVGGLTDDFEIAESQNIATFDWVDPPSKGQLPGQTAHETPLLNGGIPISPGEVITANSDVIVGRPGRIGPRIPSIPLNQLKTEDDTPIGMRPPPVPNNIWPKKNHEYKHIPVANIRNDKPLPNIIHAPNKDDYVGPPPPIQSPKENLRGDKRKHIPLTPPRKESRPYYEQEQHSHNIKYGNNNEIPLNQNVYGSQNNYGTIYTTNEVNYENNLPNLQDSIQKNYDTVAKHSYPMYAQDQSSVIVPGIPINDFNIQPSVINEPIVLPEVIERSTGQPLLVNIQPSQVAFVNIPFNRTTALIYGGSTEPHKNGQYFDDPSPYPEPEFSGIEFNNGVRHVASVYHDEPPNQKQVNGVIKVGNQLINVEPSASENQKVQLNINPTKPHKDAQIAFGSNHEISVNVPPISFGLMHQGNDFNAHVINHGDIEFRPPATPYEVTNEHVGSPSYQQIPQHFNRPDNNKIPINDMPFGQNYNRRPVNDGRPTFNHPDEILTTRPNNEGRPNFQHMGQVPGPPSEKRPVHQYKRPHNPQANDVSNDLPNRRPEEIYTNPSTDDSKPYQNKHKYSSTHKNNNLRPRLPRPDRPNLEISEYMTPPPFNRNTLPNKSPYIRRPVNKRPLPIPLSPDPLPSNAQIYNNQQQPQNTFSSSYNTHLHHQDSQTFLHQSQIVPEENKNSVITPSQNNVQMYETHNIQEDISSNLNGDLDIGDHRDDDLENEEGEVIQESNSRPLLPGEVPFEILKAKTSTTTQRTTLKSNHTIRFTDAEQMKFPYYNNDFADQEPPRISQNARPFATNGPHVAVKPEISSSQSQRPQNPVVRPENQQTNQINNFDIINTNQFNDSNIFNNHDSSSEQDNTYAVKYNYNANTDSFDQNVTYKHKNSPNGFVVVGSQFEKTGNPFVVSGNQFTDNLGQVHKNHEKINGNKIKEQNASPRPEVNTKPNINLINPPKIASQNYPTFTENTISAVFGFKTKNPILIYKPKPTTTTTHKPVIIYIDDTVENKEEFFHHNTNRDRIKVNDKRPSVTSLPIDALTTKTPYGNYEHGININTQTEKPFISQQRPSLPSNQVNIRDVVTSDRPKLSTRKTTTYSPIPEITPELNTGEVTITYTNVTTEFSDMEVMKPPPLVTDLPIKQPDIEMQPPKMEADTHSADILRVSTVQPVSDIYSSSPKPYIPKPLEEMAPPPQTTTDEEVLGMSPPPLVSPHTPIVTNKPITTSKPVFSMEVDIPKEVPIVFTPSTSTSTEQYNRFTRPRRPYTRRPAYHRTTTTLRTTASTHSLNRRPTPTYPVYNAINRNNTSTSNYVHEDLTTEDVITPSPTIKVKPSIEIIIGHPNLNTDDTSTTTTTVSKKETKAEVELAGSEVPIRESVTEKTVVLNTQPSDLLSIESATPTILHSIPSSVPSSKKDIVTQAVHHAGNEIKVVDENVTSINTSTRKALPTVIKDSKPVLPTRYITYTKTSTVTITKTTVVKTLGGPPSTLTILVTKTEKSTIVDTVTEFHTLVKPTSIIETVTTTIQQGSSLYPANVYGSTYPSIQVRPSLVIPFVGETASDFDDSSEDDLEDFIITETDPPRSEENHDEVNNSDTILVVMTDKNTKGIIKVPTDSYETQERDEIIPNNEVNNVLLAGILSANHPSPGIPEPKVTDKCEPDCKASRNELCQKVEGIMRCVCRPGFARMFPDRPCLPTYTYNLRIALDRIGKDKLHYYNDLSNSNSTEFVKFAQAIHEALDRMVMQSDLRDIFHGVQVHSFTPSPTTKGIVTRFYLQLSDNIDETRLEEIFQKYLRNNNYSLGGTDIFASPQSLDELRAQDFDECSFPRFHDCSENAQCFNLKGTYTCSCREGFSDLSENILYPGRICSAEQIGCERCNYHGTCYSREDDDVLCECFQWYTGDSCHINLKVLLIALVTLGIVLFALLLICIILTCARRKPRKAGVASGMSFLPQRVGNSGNRGTLDRRAMIQDTSSEDSRSETNTLPYVQKQKKPKGALKKTSKVSMQHTGNVENGENTLTFSDQKDRSLTVMIPRAKYHPAPPTSPLINYTTFDARKPSVPSVTEAKLLSYLDAGPSPSKTESKRKFSNTPSESFIEEKPSSRKTSGALVSAGFEVSATVVNNMGTLGTTCGTEADRSENATLIQKISADLLSSTGTRSQFNTLRKSLVNDDIESSSNWLDIVPRVTTVSESRSYDETTIPPPMKSFRNDYDSKPSSQHPNDEANTMAERDLGSTFLLPHTHLYKPDRGSDISGFESL